MILFIPDMGPVIFSGGGQRVIETEFLPYEGPPDEAMSAGGFYGRRAARRVPILAYASETRLWNNLTPYGYFQS